MRTSLYPVARLTVVALLTLGAMGCLGIVDVSNPTSGAPGAPVQFDVSFVTPVVGSGVGAGMNTVTQISVDVPIAWTLVSAAYNGSVDGNPVAGVATQSATPGICTATTTPGPVAAGFKRIYLTIDTASMTSEFDGQLHLVFNPGTTPGINYVTFFGTAKDDASVPLCGSDSEGPLSAAVLLTKIRRYVVGSETVTNFDVSSAFNDDVIVNKPSTIDTTQNSVGDPGTENFAFVTQTAANAIAGGPGAVGLPDDGHFTPAGAPPVTLAYRNSNLEPPAMNAHRSGPYTADTFAFTVPHKKYNEIHLFAASGIPASDPETLLDPTAPVYVDVTLNYSDGTVVKSGVGVPPWSAISTDALLSGPTTSTSRSRSASIKAVRAAASAQHRFGAKVADIFIPFNQALFGNLSNLYAYPLNVGADAAALDGSALEDSSEIRHYIWGIPIATDPNRTLEGVSISRDDSSASVLTFYGASGVQVGAASGLSLTKALTGLLRVGTQGSYRLVATNTSAATVTNAQVIDNLPFGMELVGATSTQGTCGPGSPTQVVCSLGTLAAGASATIDVQVTPTSPGDSTNVAQFTADASGPVTVSASSNAVSAPVAVADIPALSEWALMILAATLAAIALLRVKG